MPPRDPDYRTVESYIGEIKGLLKPIPGQLNQLFELDRVKQTDITTLKGEVEHVKERCKDRLKLKEKEDEKEDEVKKADCDILLSHGTRIQAVELAVKNLNEKKSFLKRHIATFFVAVSGLVVGGLAIDFIKTLLKTAKELVVTP